MALQDAKLEQQKREILLEQQKEIKDTIKDYEMMRLKMPRPKA